MQGVNVEHRPERQRFEATVDGLACVADYRLDGRVERRFRTQDSKLSAKVQYSMRF
jgi:hypothetical protein